MAISASIWHGPVNIIGKSSVTDLKSKKIDGVSTCFCVCDPIITLSRHVTRLYVRLEDIQASDCNTPPAPGP